VRWPRRRPQQRPLRILAITFRGMTDVEKGFEEYFASRASRCRSPTAT
jgi:hypothetical protein